MLPLLKGSQRTGNNHFGTGIRRHALTVAVRSVRGHHRDMTKYLISFPSEAMVLTEEEFPIVVAASHAVIEEAKAAGVYVFGGGIE